MERVLHDTLIDNVYFQLGKVATHIGVAPSEDFRKIIMSDPEKEAAFIEGARLGQLLKDKEQNINSETEKPDKDLQS